MRVPVVFAVAAALAAVVPVFPVAAAAGSCPPAVTAAVQKAHPGATIDSCKREQEMGVVQFEVKIQGRDGKPLELDVNPDGKILVTEQVIALADVPAAVTRAFASKYGSVTPTRVTAATASDGRVNYELAFEVAGKKKEATFDPEGSLLDEE